MADTKIAWTDKRKRLTMVLPLATMVGVDRVAPESPDILTGLPRLTNSGTIYRR